MTQSVRQWVCLWRVKSPAHIGSEKSLVEHGVSKNELFTFSCFLLYWKVYFSPWAIGSLKSSSTDYNELQEAKPEVLSLYRIQGLLNLQFQKMSFFTFFTFFTLLKRLLFHPKPWLPKMHHIYCSHLANTVVIRHAATGAGYRFWLDPALVHSGCCGRRSASVFVFFFSYNLVPCCSFSVRFTSSANPFCLDRIWHADRVFCRVCALTVPHLACAFLFCIPPIRRSGTRYFRFLRL